MQGGGRRFDPGTLHREKPRKSGAFVFSQATLSPLHSDLHSTLAALVPQTGRSCRERDPLGLRLGRPESVRVRRSTRLWLRRAEARTEKVGTLDLAVADGAEELMLDNKRLALLDPTEPIREMEAVSDFIAARLE